MNKTKKMILNLLIFIALIFLTFYILLKDQNPMDIYNAFLGVEKKYIFMAIGAMIIYFTFETINLGRTLKTLNEKTSFIKNFKYVLIGFFFSSITPAASGGQPMQIYYMHKDKISVANSTLALLINLASFQIITISFALISLFFAPVQLDTGMTILFVVGIGLNTTALALLLIGIISKRLSQGLINIAIKILKFFKVKNVEKKQEKLENELNLYQQSAKYIKQNGEMVVKILLTTFIQIIVYYSVPYFVYLSFGFNEFNLIQIIMMQSILYATVSGIPLPGAVGVSEGGFVSIFKMAFTTSLVSSAMLITRGISFYLFVIISSIIVIVNIIKNQIGNKEERVKID